MASNRFSLFSDEIATGTSLKAILEAIAAANVGVKFERISISFKGTSATDAPILVEIARQTGSESGTTVTPQKLDDDNDDTLQVTSKSGLSSDTQGAVLYSRLVHPQGGYSWLFPPGQELKLHGGDKVAVYVTAGVDVNCVVEMIGEE